MLTKLDAQCTLHVTLEGRIDMKYNIRRNVFETNSSSSHSISIEHVDASDLIIPRDTTIEITGTLDDCFLRTQMQKLNFVVSIVASIIEDEYYENSAETSLPSVEAVINNRLFTWITDVVKENSNTHLIFKGTRKRFPYFNTTYDDDESALMLITNHQPDLINDEEKFKDIIKNIIYSEGVLVKVIVVEEY